MDNPGLCEKVSSWLKPQQGNERGKKWKIQIATSISKSFEVLFSSHFDQNKCVFLL